jgi:hypothetical protein
MDPTRSETARHLGAIPFNIHPLADGRRGEL